MKQTHIMYLLFIGAMSGAYASEPARKAQKTSHQSISIFKAIENGDIETVKNIIDSNPNQRYRKHTRSNNTPLHTAIDNNKKDIAELLLALEVEPNTYDNTGYTPLLTAVQSGYYELVDLLLEHGADPYQIKISGYKSTDNVELTAAGLAAKLGHVNVLRTLANRNVNFRECNDGDQLLHLALKRIVDYNVHITEDKVRNVIELVECLLNGGLSQNTQNEYGETALQNAFKLLHKDLPCESAAIELIHLFLKHGANPNIRCKLTLSSDFTPLHRAVLLYDKRFTKNTHNTIERVIHLLLLYGADPHIPTCQTYLLYKSENFMLQKPLLRPLSPHSGVAPFHMICTYDNEDAAIKIASLMASHNASTSILRKMRLFDHAMDSWDLNMNTLAARLNKNRLAMMLTTLHNQTTYKVSGSTQGPHDIQNHPHRISTLAKYIIYEDTSIENKDQAMRNFLNMIYRQNEAYEKSLQYMLFTLELAGSHAQDTTSTRTIINRMHDRVQEHSEATQNNQNGPVELLLQFVATRTDCILADTFAYVISEYKHMLPADFDTFIQNYAVTNMHNAYPQGMSSYAINRNIYNLLMHNNTNNIITDLAQRMRRKEAFPVEVKYAVQHATKTAAEYRDQETGDTFLHCMAYMPKSYVLFPYIAQDVLQQQGGFTYHQNRGLEVQPLYNADNETPENIARREHPDTHFVDKLQDHKGTYYMIHSGSPHITSDSNNNYRHAQLSSDYSYEIAKFL